MSVPYWIFKKWRFFQKNQEDLCQEVLEQAKARKQCTSLVSLLDPCPEFQNVLDA